MEDMHVIVTGAAGLIGSHLVDRLLLAGHAVVAVDDFSTGRSHNLDEARSDDRFTLLEGDVTDPSVWDRIDRLGEPSRLFHLACPPSPVDFTTMPLQILRTCSTGTLLATGFARHHGCRLLLASTSEVYGEPLVHPQTESYTGNVTTVGPRACYDEGKRFAEAVVSSSTRSEGLDGCIARIFNTYGPRMRADDGRVVASFVNSALRDQPLTVHGSGDQTRSFCFVDDLVQGLMALMASDLAGPVNIGNDAEMTILDLAETVLEVTGSRSRIEHRPLPVDDPTRRRPDLTVARSELGWEPTTSLRSGISRVVEHFRRHA